VSGVRPPVLVVSVALALAAAVSACSTGTNAASEPPGFSTAYSATSADGGAALAFEAVRGSGPGSGWAVGEGGTAAQLVGNTWTAVDTGSTATLGGLSAFSFGNVYAVELGGPRVLALNGRAWAPLGTDRADRNAMATFSLSPKEVWVVGNGIDRWDGARWVQEVPSGATYTSIFGPFATDLWAVGPGGIQHYDGKAWVPVAEPAGTGQLSGVWASALWDAWFVGAGGTILHWNGSAITAMDSGTTEDLTCVTGTSEIDVWAGGKDGTLLQWDGAQWSKHLTPAGVGHTVNDVWRAFDADVFLVDDTGAVTRYVP
jgi:hypothetical protein